MNDFDEFPTQAPGESPFANPMTAPSGVLPRDVLDLGYWPYRQMWFHPRETIRLIVEVNPEYHVNLLIGLAGIAESLDRASTKNTGDTKSWGVILGIAVVLGPLGALLVTWIYSHLIRITGDWMGGRGEYDEIKAAIGWAYLPSVASLGLWVLLILFFGKEAFLEEVPSLRGNAIKGIVHAFLATGFSATNLWSFVLLCHAVAEVQEYRSAWKGFGNIFLASAILVVPLLALSLLLRTAAA